MVDFYNHESIGTELPKNNGYAVGKSWSDVQVAMWREDLENGTIFKWELYADGRFPVWWLDNVLNNFTPIEQILLSVPPSLKNCVRINP